MVEEKKNILREQWVLHNVSIICLTLLTLPYGGFFIYIDGYLLYMNIVLTKNQLIKICKKKNITKYSSKNKKTLISLIKKK